MPREGIGAFNPYANGAFHVDPLEKRVLDNDVSGAWVGDLRVRWLDSMRQFVEQHTQAVLGARSVLTLAKIDVPANRKGAGSHSFRHFARPVGMDAHCSEVVAEHTLSGASYVLGQGLALAVAAGQPARQGAYRFGVGGLAPGMPSLPGSLARRHRGPIPSRFAQHPPPDHGPHGNSRPPPGPCLLEGGQQPRQRPARTGHLAGLPERLQCQVGPLGPVGIC
jgi:hypothetical protein